jgi:hypothetical protein
MLLVELEVREIPPQFVVELGLAKCRKRLIVLLEAPDKAQPDCPT